MAEEIAKQVAANTLGEMVCYVGKKIVQSSPQQLENRHRMLQEGLQSLLAVKEDAEAEVRRHRQKRTTNVYNLWINQVSKIEEQVDTMLQQYEDERPNQWQVTKRLRLSEEAEEMVEVVRKLKENLPSNFLVDNPVEPVLKQFDVPQIKDYSTLQNAFGNLLDSLKSNDANVIGVCGSKGVGKTTILQTLNNDEDVVAKLFDIVIFVRLLPEDTDKELQGKIAKRLKLEFMQNYGQLRENAAIAVQNCGLQPQYCGCGPQFKTLLELDTNDEPRVANRIHEELKNKKFLLIFDDVVGRINLSQLGIPNDNSGSKVVIATQYPLTYKLNRVEKLIEVAQLSRDEAWKMFCSIVGPIIDYPDIKTIARMVCDNCFCLPLLINKIANSFKLKESAPSWRVGLKHFLERSWPENESEGLQEIYECLKFCYDDLRDEKKQKCFLYASLYPADSKVYTDCLVECWAAHGFLGEVNDKSRYQDARDSGNAILEHLINVSLLEKGEQMIYIKMTDCIRQFALQISGSDPDCRSYVYPSEDFEQPADFETLQYVRWISMVDCNLRDLPTGLFGSMLSTLLLQKNPELVTIPQTHFEDMKSLFVLDLYGTGIRQLPSSISNLIALKGLYLNDCVFLATLPLEIRSLQHLQVLDIRGSQVIFLPSCMRSLINLRCLRTPYNKSSDRGENEDARANYDVILSLDKLEELIIEVKSYQQWCNDAENIMLRVASLKCLTTLRCSFPTARILGTFLVQRSARTSKSFTSFRFFVGCENSKRPKILESFEHRIPNYMKYHNGELRDDSIINVVLDQTHALELICHEYIGKLSDFVGLANMKNICSFLIERCSNISNIVDGNEGDEGILPNLQQLFLRYLPKLNHVFKGPLHQNTLSKLRTLSLNSCHILQSVFSRGSVQSFSNLQKLIIRDCSRIKEIVSEDSENNVLGSLQMLVLVKLPNLSIICSNLNLAWPSLKLLKIHKCPRLKTLPFSEETAANPRFVIKGEQEWWNEVELTNEDVKLKLQDIFVASNDEYF